MQPYEHTRLTEFPDPSDAAAQGRGAGALRGPGRSGVRRQGISAAAKARARRTLKRKDRQINAKVLRRALELQDPRDD